MLNKNARRIAAALSALLMGAASAAIAQTQDDPIVVTAARPEQVQGFVDNFAADAQGADQLPRWDREICMSVAGMPVRQAQFLIDRVAQRAAAVGLQPGGPGCRPNVAIYVTSSDSFARTLFDQDRSLFAYRPETNIHTLGQGALDDFLDTQRPVRWWHIARTMSADGIALSGDASSGGISNAPVARSSGSRISASTREDLTQAIVIIDARRVAGAQMTALADYVAMVTLVQINPAAAASGYPTIMSLFNGSEVNQQAPSELTTWDTAFLSGLYSANRSPATAQMHRRDIARRMSGDGAS